MSTLRPQHKIRQHPKPTFTNTLQKSINSLFKGHDLPTEEEILRSRRRRAVHAYRAKADAKRSASDRFADWMTARFGTITFLLVNNLFFGTWILLNTGRIPGVSVFDPYPFPMLTTMVSLEAIFLAIVVLISQNRASKIAEIREEEDLQINMIAEEEITKVIELLGLLLRKHNIDINKDESIARMLKPTNSSQIEDALEKQLL